MGIVGRKQVRPCPAVFVEYATIESCSRYYSLEVAQNPLRARMCGFGDKVRPVHYYCLVASGLCLRCPSWHPPFAKKAAFAVKGTCTALAQLS